MLNKKTEKNTVKNTFLIAVKFSSTFSENMKPFSLSNTGKANKSDDLM